MFGFLNVYHTINALLEDDKVKYNNDGRIDNSFQNCVARDYSGYTFEHVPIETGKKTIGELYTKLRLRPV